MATWQFPLAIVPRAGARRESFDAFKQRLIEALGEPSPYWDASGALGCQRRDVGQLRRPLHRAFELRQRRNRRAAAPDRSARERRAGRRLIAFAAGDELVLRTSDGATIEPDAKHVAAAAHASDGARFVADPIAFLAALHSATRT
jgi:hypothetical protein